MGGDEIIGSFLDETPVSARDKTVMVLCSKPVKWNEADPRRNCRKA